MRIEPGQQQPLIAQLDGFGIVWLLDVIGRTRSNVAEGWAAGRCRRRLLEPSARCGVGGDERQAAPAAAEE